MKFVLPVPLPRTLFVYFGRGGRHFAVTQRVMHESDQRVRFISCDILLFSDLTSLGGEAGGSGCREFRLCECARSTQSQE